MQDLGLHDMQVYLPGLKYKPPSLMLHRYMVLLFAIQSLLNFLIHRLIRVYCMPFLHLNINAVPILGYSRQLLLSLFIKSDHASKCGVAWFIVKELNKLFIS
jgi:hypothetical protein